MSYKVQATVLFEKQLKRLVKKYPSLKIEFAGMIETLGENPETGTPLGNNCYKIRLAIASKGKGKSGGARLITHVQVTATTVYLLSIYDKSEQSDISDKDLKDWLRSLP
ncbi:MAG: type II toxin-antitoxin system RelE/ParE family toxin [Bacteroidetes bacterium]|nr:type II toxin-antitoxin system RelE/ParE family toxin [Bacteroidota bacterium]